MSQCNWKAGLVVGALALCSATTQAAGLLKPANAAYQDLEIKSHHVTVSIQDGYAVTQVEQVFHNPNSQDLEALYSFPVPQGAAVGEFTYWINGQAVTGEVVEKQQARQIYDQEKAAGRHTALTEQDDFRTFGSRVYPVQASSDVRIKLVYLQQENIDTGTGRYVYPLEEGGVDEEQNAFWTRNDVVKEDFSFTLELNSSYPIDGVRLPAHSQAQVTQLDSQKWQVKLGNRSEEAGQHSAKLDKDILVYWRHQTGLPGSVDLVTHKDADKKRGAFMLTLTPGDDLQPTSGSRDWIFVLDKSGSMDSKYATLVEGVRQGLAKLPSGDRFRVITFNSSATDITSGFQPVTAKNVEGAMQTLISQGVDGGTNLYQGLKMGLKGLDADRASAVILVTDGVANVGVTEKKQFLQLLEKRDVRLYSFIMGNSANRPLLEGMTKVSNGFAANISNSDDIMGQLMLATSKMTHEALRNIQVSIKGVKVTGQTPENPASLYRGQQLTVFGHYYGQGEATLTLSGSINGQRQEYKTRVNFPQTSSLNPELERLWAYANIRRMQDKMDYLGEETDTKQAITDLAVEYGLVTNYTSLLVVEEEVFQQLGIQRTNQQRVAREQTAREQRAAAPEPTSNRADTNEPMFQLSRPSTGGGGAMSPWLLSMMSLLLMAKLFRRTNNSQK